MTYSEQDAQLTQRVLASADPDVLDLDPEIDRLAKVHAEAGFPRYDRYLLGLPVLLALAGKPLGQGTQEHPVETTVRWTDTQGLVNEQHVSVQHFEATGFVFEVTEFVHHRASLL